MCFKCDLILVCFQRVFSIYRASKKFFSRSFTRLKFIFSDDISSSSGEPRNYELVSVEASEESVSMASASHQEVNFAATSQENEDQLYAKFKEAMSAVDEELKAEASAINNIYTMADLKRICSWSMFPDYDDNDLNPPAHRQPRRRSNSTSSLVESENTNSASGPLRNRSDSSISLDRNETNCSVSRFRRGSSEVRENLRRQLYEFDLFLLRNYKSGKPEDRPESPTSSLSSERTESANLEESVSYASSERQADFSLSSASSESSYSLDSSEDSERSGSRASSMSRDRCDSSSSAEYSTVPSEDPVDPIESFNERRGLLDSFENSGSQDSLDSLQSTQSTENDNLTASNEQQETENSEAIDVDAIAEHDHLFNVRIYSEEDMSNAEAYETMYRSATEHLLVGFTYKWGRYANETSEICLLQFCSVEGLVVFHTIRRNQSTIPPILQEILWNENIRKVGIFPGPLFGGLHLEVNNALDLRYALLISGITPKKIGDLVKSILNYSINIYRGTRPTDMYFLETDSQYRTAYLEVFFGLKIFWHLREDFNLYFSNNFEHLCEIHKGKVFRIGRPM